MLVLRHTASGETWNLSTGRLVVARKDALAQLQLDPGDAPLALEDALVSRRHAVISADGGRFWIADEGSTDGTYLNENRIDQRSPIAEGDTVRFGDSVLVGTIEDMAPAAPVAPERGADRTIQYRPALAPVRQAEVQHTLVEPPLPVTRPPLEFPVRFNPVPAGTAIQQQPPASPSVAPSEIPATQSASAPAPSQEQASTAATSAALQEVARAVRQLERAAASAIQCFEQAGGRQAVNSVLTLSARLQSGTATQEDIDTLVKHMPTVCRLLRVELSLIDMLSTRASNAPE